MLGKSRTASLIAIATAGLTACTATQGVRPDANASASFVRGVSTEQDVDARLGKPLKTVRNSDGTMTATYHYGEANVSPLILVGVASGKDIITTVNFDHSGRYLGMSQETDNR